jgi:hypothetical protein
MVELGVCFATKLLTRPTAALQDTPQALCLLIHPTLLPDQGYGSLSFLDAYLCLNMIIHY